MPRGDGTGPRGQGPGTGRGMGRSGMGRGSGAGPDGYCVCPACGEKAPHQRGVPCSDARCPKCGARMVREQ